MNFQAFFVSNSRINFKTFKACFLFWGCREMKIARGEREENRRDGMGFMGLGSLGRGFGLWVRGVGGGGHSQRFSSRLL
ncbi:unnamed protein product [Prunus brigantina]